MENGIVIEDSDLERYRQQLEDLLPSQIDGISSEGGLMVLYQYVPRSIQLEHLVNQEELDPLTPYWSAWTYQITQAEIIATDPDLDEEFGTIAFRQPVRFEGYIELAIDTDSNLVTEDIDFLLGLENATEGQH